MLILDDLQTQIFNTKWNAALENLNLKSARNFSSMSLYWQTCNGENDHKKIKRSLTIYSVVIFYRWWRKVAYGEYE